MAKQQMYWHYGRILRAVLSWRNRSGNGFTLKFNCLRNSYLNPPQQPEAPPPVIYTPLYNNTDFSTLGTKVQFLVTERKAKSRRKKKVCCRVDRGLSDQLWWSLSQEAFSSEEEAAVWKSVYCPSKRERWQEKKTVLIYWVSFSTLSSTFHSSFSARLFHKLLVNTLVVFFFYSFFSPFTTFLTGPSL